MRRRKAKLSESYIFGREKQTTLKGEENKERPKAQT